MSVNNFDAVIFDLDGVITQTALVHSAAWKSMFDSYLKEREARYGEAFKAFSHTDDYLPYVDGKPRYKGVESFLKSRNIDIPFGNPEDGTDKETICGIGNRKNIVFNEILERDGVKVYDSTVELIKQLKEKGIRVGVASSSKNCEAVLKAAGLLELMETRVDGVVSAELGLKGKPEPDIFTTACDNLEVTYDKAVVVEDAVSGVQAGRKGNFGFVLGIAREDNAYELQKNGADIVVTDITGIGLQGIEDWFTTGLEKDNWSITYHDYDLKKEKSRESLLATGNGYFGTRGTMEEISACDTNYPGTYIAGLYNRLQTKVGNRIIENEDLVNCPNWLHFMIKIDDGDWINLNAVKILKIFRNLNFKNGLLYRDIIIKDNEDHDIRIESWRIASMHNPNLAAIRYKLTPLNYSGNITIKTGIDGDIINDGVARYRELKQQHLEAVDQGVIDNKLFVVVNTTQSKSRVTEAAKIITTFEEKEIEPVLIDDDHISRIYASYQQELEPGKSITVEKIVYIDAEYEKGSTMLQKGFPILNAGSFNQVLNKSTEAWQKIWDKIDIKLVGDRLSQKLLRLHLYHLMVSVSPNNKEIDAGIGARGLHGEAYRGHIFWDELFILPFYDMHFPEVSKSLLMYRYRRLDEARKYAKEYGYSGAMFPWQSGSNGREETQVVHLNPLTGTWGSDYSSLQRHVSLAIAYNIWDYYWITGDINFIKDFGLEMLIEICRFWAHKASYDPAKGRYVISNVMGPDEFHEMYEEADEGGLRDNAYTSIMVVWMIQKTLLLINELSEKEKTKVYNSIGFKETELEKWDDILQKLNLVISPEGIISQFDGYFDLKELDWDHYRKEYGNIYRMDRILKAEGKSADEYKVAKQADTLMTFYNLEKSAVDNILAGLGYKMPDDYLKQNLEYYLARTSHGSTLSRVVHAHLAALINDFDLSWKLYSDALSSDYNDIQGGTTAEGIHTGVMAGTILIALFTYAGLNLRNEVVEINPSLPESWRSIAFKFNFKGKEYKCYISKNRLILEISSKDAGNSFVKIAKTTYHIGNNKRVEIEI